MSMFRAITGIRRAARQKLQFFHQHYSNQCEDDSSQRACLATSSVPFNNQSTYHVNYPQAFVSIRRFSEQHGQRRKSESSERAKQQSWQHKPDNDFWSNVQKGYYSKIEALGLGTVVFLGLHFSKLAQFCSKELEWRDIPRAGLDRYCFSGLLFKLAQSLPQLNSPVSSRKSVASTAGIQAGANKQQTTDELLSEFDNLYKKYIATGVEKNVAGLHSADQGKMTTAFQHWQAASEYGNAKAQFNIAVCYEQGLGIERNVVQAVEYYKLAASSGHAQSLYNLGLLYMHGGEDLIQRPSEAFYLLEKAAQLGLAQAQTYVGVMYTEDDRQDINKAVRFFKQAAAQGDPDAQYFLGTCYEQGWGVDQDECQSAELYDQAAQAGNEGAIYSLAVFHEYGLGGLPIDKLNAKDLYEKAAEKGNGNAKLALHRIDAEDAIKEWEETEAKKVPEPKNPVLRSVASSPTLSDYIREHVDNFGIEMCFEFDLASKATSSTNRLENSNSNSFSFTIGDDFRNDLDTRSDINDQDEITLPSLTKTLSNIRLVNSTHEPSSCPDLNKQIDVLSTNDYPVGITRATSHGSLLQFALSY